MKRLLLFYNSDISVNLYFINCQLFSNLYINLLFVPLQQPIKHYRLAIIVKSYNYIYKCRIMVNNQQNQQLCNNFLEYKSTIIVHGPSSNLPHITVNL